MQETTQVASWYYIKNWWKFQHYANRRPPWIKLHRSIEDDPAFQSLREIDQYRLIKLWLWSATNDGRFPHDSVTVRSRLRLDHLTHTNALLARLESSGLISQSDIRGDRRTRASKLDAQSIQSNSEVQITSNHQSAAHKGRGSQVKTDGAASDSTALFDRLWKLYPEKGKRAGVDWTAQIFLGLEIHDKPDDILAGLALWLTSEDWAQEDGKFIPSLENFLRKQLWKVKPKSQKETADEHLEYFRQWQIKHGKIPRPDDRPASSGIPDKTPARAAGRVR